MGLEPYEITDENNPTASVTIECYTRISIANKVLKKLHLSEFYITRKSNIDNHNERLVGHARVPSSISHRLEKVWVFNKIVPQLTIRTLMAVMREKMQTNSVYKFSATRHVI